MELSNGGGAERVADSSITTAASGSFAPYSRAASATLLPTTIPPFVALTKLEFCAEIFLHVFVPVEVVGRKIRPQQEVGAQELQV